MNNRYRRTLVIEILLILILSLTVSILLWMNAASAWWQACPMHWGWYQSFGYSHNTQQRLSIYDVRKRLESYISRWGGLSIVEIMEFSNNFYAIVAEDEVGWGAFELIVDPYSGVVAPEPGPNMMWNLKYGMHGRVQSLMNQWSITLPNEMPITSDEALKIAYEYLSRIYPGREIEVEEPTIFYGYYTLDYNLDGVLHGMLSVNGFTGSVWYHSWHGDFIQEIELVGD